MAEQRRNYPYAGLVRTRTGTLAQAPSAPHILDLAPTEMGKTSGHLACAAIAWQASALLMSSKDDLMQMAATRRYGPHVLCDLRGVHTPYYAGIEPVLLDPTKFVGSEKDAREMAMLLVTLSNMTAGATVSQQGNPYWDTQTVNILTPILLAASPVGNGKGIRWALQVVINPKTPPAEHVEYSEPMPTAPARWAVAAKAATALANAQDAEAVAAKALARFAAPAAPEAAGDDGEPEDPDAVHEEGGPVDDAPQEEEELDELSPPAEPDPREDEPADAGRELAETVDEAGGEDSTDEDSADPQARPPAAVEQAGDLPQAKAQAALNKAVRARAAAQAAHDAAVSVAQDAEEADAAAVAGFSAAVNADKAKRLAARAKPSWFDVRGELDGKAEWFVDNLENVAEYDGKQRDSLRMAMVNALSPWTGSHMTDPDMPVLDLAVLENPTGTVSVLSEPSTPDAAAGVVLLNSVVSKWRQKTSNKERMYEVLAIGDEFNNIGYLPGLDVKVSEGRGLGVRSIWATQSIAQIMVRYGHLGGESFLNAIPMTLFFAGSGEAEALKMAAAWSGDIRRQAESVDQNTGQRTMAEWASTILTASDLTPRQKGFGRLIARGTAGIKVELPKFEDFREIYDKSLRQYLQEKGN